VLCLLHEDAFSISGCIFLEILLYSKWHLLSFRKGWQRLHIVVTCEFVYEQIQYNKVAAIGWRPLMLMDVMKTTIWRQRNFAIYSILFGNVTKIRSCQFKLSWVFSWWDVLSVLEFAVWTQVNEWWKMKYLAVMCNQTLIYEIPFVSG
jgi:hypothetical protein